MIRVGTAGWDYPDWHGTVYPKPAPRGFDPLVFLTGIFDVVEVNATFYRVPSASTVASWVRRTADRPDFRFTVKLPRVFTHARAGEPAGVEPRGPAGSKDDGASLHRTGAVAPPAGGAGATGARENQPSHDAGNSLISSTGEATPAPQGSLTDEGSTHGPAGGFGAWRTVGGAGPGGRADLDRTEKEFRAAIAPLLQAGRLGAVLVQFPQSFHARPEERALLEEILDRFTGLPLVVELRHADWADPAATGRLRERGVGFCNIDQPCIGSTLRPTALVTSPVAYVRLHGRNAAAWFREDAGRDARYDYLYGADELGPWIASIQRMAEEGAETYVIANNHFRGKAAVNALQIKAALEAGLVEVPPPLLAAYPELTPITRPRKDTLPF